MQCPEQVRVVVLAGGDLTAVGGDEIDRDQVVAGEPVPPLEPAGSAAQGETGDAGCGYSSPGGRQAMFLRGAVELAPRHPGPDTDLAAVGVDLDPVHRPDVDDEAAVVDRHPGDRVAPGTHGDLQHLAVGQRQRFDDVGR